MKSTDEIKKGLEWCASTCADCPEECPYMPDCDGIQFLKDALAIIQQIEAERDAAVADITRMVQEPYDPCYCDYCKLTEEECAKSNCRGRNAFVWRGVQKEATP